MPSRMKLSPPGRNSDSRRRNQTPVTANYDPPQPQPATLTPNAVPVGQAVASPVAPVTRTDEIRAIPTISSLSAGTLHAAPVHEVNLLICPIRDPPAAAVVAAHNAAASCFRHVWYVS